MKVHWVDGVGETHKKHSTITPQHKKNHDKTTKIHSTKPTIKTNQPLMRVERKKNGDEREKRRAGRGVWEGV